MRRLALLAALLLAAPPAFAADFSVTVKNKSSQAVTRLNTFAVDADGQPVEDNLGALAEDIPPGATGRIDLAISTCQPVYVALALGNGDDDLTTIIDTCRNKTLVVGDR